MNNKAILTHPFKTLEVESLWNSQYIRDLSDLHRSLTNPIKALSTLLRNLTKGY